MSDQRRSNSMWVAFALMTVLTWGVYGALLNWGAIGFEHNRIKAFLFVGVAYFLIAVLAPLIYLIATGQGFNFASAGIKWSLLAGTAGALGALTVLFALNMNPLSAQKGGGPLAASQVMSLVFA